jgi:hypothetical protein
MGKLAKIKTVETDSSVEDFINSLKDETKREDCLELIRIMKKATKDKPKLWGTSIIGFGNKRYVSPASGREVDWFKIGFAPRKANISLYLVFDIKKFASQLKKLGRHKTGAGCLYINKLEDIDLAVLQEIIVAALKTK